MKKYLFILPSIFLVSCASFQSRHTREIKQNLTEDILSSFPKKYESVSHGGFFRDNKSDTSKPVQLFKVLADSTQFSSIADEKYVEIAFPNKNIVLFKLYSDTTLVRQVKLSGKLKKDGFFHLNNTLRKCHGLPYILGGCYIRKTRLGVSKSGDLIMNNAIDSYGAFMLVLGFGYRYNAGYFYRTIK